MMKKISSATPLVVLLLALLLLVLTVSSCSNVDIKADVEFSAETGQLRISNNDTSDWHDVEVTLNHAYQLSISSIPAGAVYTVEPQELTTVGGIPFDPSTTLPSAILIECQTAKGYGLYMRAWG